jgi:photosystem II stability/assembly factor-like uncharacterized protein
MKLQLLFYVSVAMCVAGFSQTARGQWEHPGPSGGGQITSFASSGSDLYVSIRSSGVFRSRDSGVTWSHASIGLTDSSVALLAAFGPIVLAVTDSAGLFRSTDQGSHWSPAKSGFPAHSHDLSFAAVGTIIFVATDDSIYRSTDGALHWNSMNTGLTKEPGSTLVSSGTVLYYSNGYQVVRSVDSGVAWVNVSKGLSTSYLINSLAARDSLVFAGTRGGIFRSSDRGRNWEGPDTTGLQIHGQFFGLPKLALCDTTLFGLTSSGYNQVAIFRSTDNGLSWVHVDTAGTGLDTSDSSPFLDHFGPILLSGDGDGVVRSSDGGISWSRSNNGIYLYDTGFRIYAPLVYLGNSLIAVGDGLYSSTDLGAHWKKYNTLNGYRTNDFASLGRYAFAATDSDGILRSSDNGATWTVLDGMTNVYPVSSLAVSAGFVFAATDGGGIYRSTDSGSIWIHVLSDGPQATVSSNGHDIFALFYDNQGITVHDIFRSTNSGTTWADFRFGPEYVWIRQLWVNKEFVFAGSYGLFRSPIDTSNWQGFNGLKSVSSLLVMDSLMFLAGSQGVLVSSDNADHWDSAGLTQYVVRSFLIADGYVFAGTNDGLWRRPLSDFPVGPPALVASPVTQPNIVACYPNPTNGLVTIQGDAINITHVTITNILGESLIEQSTPAAGAGLGTASVTLDLSKLPAGTYECVVRMNGRVQEIPIVVTR